MSEPVDWSDWDGMVLIPQTFTVDGFPEHVYPGDPTSPELVGAKWFIAPDGSLVKAVIDGKAVLVSRPLRPGTYERLGS